MEKVFEYMGWENRLPHKTVYDALNGPHPLDGNDMVLAIQKMQEKGDWSNFLWDIGIGAKKEVGVFEYQLFGSPDNFFKLMEEWLEHR